MKKQFSLLAALCICLCAAAQKHVVVVDHFTASSCKQSDLINLRNHVISGINEIGTVDLIDVEAEEALSVEATRRSNESALADETARLGVMKTLGAHYLLTGTASKLGADRKQSNHYTGNVAFTLKVVNVEDGTLIGAETYQYSNLAAGSSQTADGALQATLALVKNSMSVFASKYFKANGVIVELGEMKGGKLKTCYINLGSASGMEVGEDLLIHEIKMIAGVQAREEVGKLKVETVLADGLSKCKVVSGADKVLEAFQAGHELCVEGKETKRVKGDAAEAGRDAMAVGRTAVDAGRTALEIGAGISKIIKIFR